MIKNEDINDMIRFYKEVNVILNNYNGYFITNDMVFEIHNRINKIIQRFTLINPIFQLLTCDMYLKPKPCVSINIKPNHKLSDYVCTLVTAVNDTQYLLQKL